MSVLRRIIRKKNGAKETVHLGALAKNVTQDATHRFVSDTEKQTWNGKANPGDIPSGAAADYGVANNDTTNRSDMLVTAQVAYQHGKEIDQLNSEMASLTDSGAITGMDAREDGVYITYVPTAGADAVTKKLGSPADSILLAGGRFSGTGENSGNNARILLSDVFERVEVDYTSNSSLPLYLYYYKNGSYVKNEAVNAGSKFVFYPNETYDEIRITMFQNSTFMFTYTITGYFQ